MATRKTTKKVAKKRAKGRGTPRTQRGKLAALLKRFEEQLGGHDMKISVAEYIRLLQMKREIEGESPRDVKVTWVEADASEK